mgnify:CR=1 FL=1
MWAGCVVAGTVLGGLLVLRGEEPSAPDRCGLRLILGAEHGHGAEPVPEARAVDRALAAYDNVNPLGKL